METKAGNEKNGKFNLSPLEEMLTYSMRPEDAVEALTDLLTDYTMMVSGEEDRESYRMNVSTIYVLIKAFRKVDKLSNI